MTIEQLNRIGQEAANQIAGKYGITKSGKVVIGFSISPNRESEGYTATVDISTADGGMEGFYEITNVNPVLFRSEDEARQIFSERIEQFARNYFQIG